MSVLFPIILKVTFAHSGGAIMCNQFAIFLTLKTEYPTYIIWQPDYVFCAQMGMCYQLLKLYELWSAYGAHFSVNQLGSGLKSIGYKGICIIQAMS